MFNVNDYKISRAIVALEREVNYLKISNTTLIRDNYYTKEETNNAFLVNDVEFDQTFRKGTIEPSQWSSICYGDSFIPSENDKFVAVSWKGICAYSKDGITFTKGSISNKHWYGICHDSTYGKYVTIGESNGSSCCAYSDDGINFTDGVVDVPSHHIYNAIAYGNHMFLAVGYRYCGYSKDGINFTTVDTVDVYDYVVNWSTVAYGANKFVIVSNFNYYAYTTDGKTFTKISLDIPYVSPNVIRYVTTERFYNTIVGKFVRMGKNKCLYSEDGINFTEGNIDMSFQWNDVCYGNGIFVACGDHCFAWSNKDDLNFTKDTINSERWTCICYGNGKFVALSSTADGSYDSYNVWTDIIKISAKNVALKHRVYTREECDEKFAPKEQSHTITHLCPVDESEDINSFVIGTPVYMTGNVYVKDKQNNSWNKSTSTDSIDCISSVKTSGTWREYLGICTHILLPKSKEDSQPNINENPTEIENESLSQKHNENENEALSQKHDENEVLSRNCGEIKFASHGDYMIKVSNSSEFKVGDIVYLNENGEGKLEFKVLTEDVVLTAKINKLTVGMVTGIIDETTLSVFKE